MKVKVLLFALAISAFVMVPYGFRTQAEATKTRLREPSGVRTSGVPGSQ